MRIKSRLFLVLGVLLANVAIILWIVFGGLSSGTVAVRDATKMNVITMAAPHYRGPLSASPSGITVHIRGKIDGSAYVYLPEWGSNRLSGDVDWKRNGDWFSTSCVLYYFPDQVRAGSLRVHYTYH